MIGQVAERSISRGTVCSDTRPTTLRHLELEGISTSGKGQPAAFFSPEHSWRYLSIVTLLLNLVRPPIIPHPLTGQFNVPVYLRIVLRILFFDLVHHCAQQATLFIVLLSAGLLPLGCILHHWSFISINVDLSDDHGSGQYPGLTCKR